MNMASVVEEVPEDEFSMETRMVVLSFMGLVPADLTSQSISGSGSLTSSGSSSERQRRSLPEQSSFDVPPPRGSVKHERSSSDTWQRALPSLPESSLVEKVMSHEKTDFASWREESVTSPEIVTSLEGLVYRQEGVSTQGEDETDLTSQAKYLQTDSLDVEEEDEPDVLPNGIGKAKLAKFGNLVQPGNSSASNDSFPQVPGMGSPLSANRSPPSKNRMFGQRSTDRQISSTSTLSDATDASDISSMMMSTRSTGSRASGYIDIQCNDVDQMVRQGVLPPQVLPLQHQLNEEMEQTVRRQSLHKNKSPSKGRTPSVTPPVSTNTRPPLIPSASVTTPQTEVAEQLRHIGDMAQMMYGDDIDRAFQSVISVPQDQLTYDLMEQILLELIEHIPIVSRRVALVMLLSQRLVMYGRSLHRLVNYTVRFLISKMASYIVTHGGWNSISLLENTLDPPVSPTDVHPVLPNSDDVDSSVLPSSGSLHTVSTSNTLVPDNFDEDTLTGDSMIDSGFQAESLSGDAGSTVTSPLRFPSGAEGFPHAEGLPRDTTLDNIASLPRDLTPLEARAFPETGAASSSDHGNNNTNKVSNEHTPGKHHTGKPSAAAVKQARLLRQVSEQLNHDTEKERLVTDIVQTIGIAALGTAAVVLTAAFIYKRFLRK